MSFDTIPQVCKDIILDYWSAVKEIKYNNRIFYHYQDIGYALGQTCVDAFEFNYVMDTVKEIAPLKINKSIMKYNIKHELEYYFLCV